MVNAKIPGNANSDEMDLVVMGHSPFHLMLFVSHVFGFFLYPGFVSSGCGFIWRREQ